MTLAEQLFVRWVGGTDENCPSPEIKDFVEDEKGDWYKNRETGRYTEHTYQSESDGKRYSPKYPFYRRLMMYAEAVAKEAIDSGHKKFVAGIKDQLNSGDLADAMSGYPIRPKEHAPLPWYHIAVEPHEPGKAHKIVAANGVLVCWVAIAADAVLIAERMT